MNQQAPIIDEENFVAQEKKRKERLTRSMVLNGFLILLMTAVSVSYALPKYEEIWIQQDEANELIAKIESLKNDGMTPAEFVSALGRVAGKSAKNPIFEDKDKLAEAMEMDPQYSGTYYAWLNQEVGKEALDRYDKVIAQKREIIGNIIPTFTDSLPGEDLGFDRDRITVATFIRHIEENIFKQFKVSAFTPLGVDRVSFDSSKASIVNIGTFKTEFAIEGQNSQILKLVEYVQDSGKVKVENGKLVALYPTSKNKKDPTLSDLNNLLITIDVLDAEKSFANPEAKNTVKLGLSFYVKGRTYASLIEIRSMVMEKIKKLKDDVEKLSKTCSGKKSPVCDTDAGVSAVSATKNLVSEITSIDSRAQEMLKVATVSDLAAEFDKVFAIYASVRTVETGYLKQKAILEKAVKNSAGNPSAPKTQQ